MPTRSPHRGWRKFRSDLLYLTLMFSDNTTSKEMRAVTDAAAILYMREVDLFRLAHLKRWGREISPVQLERLFAAYMFERHVPVWVREFSELVHRRQHYGTLASLHADAKHYRKLPKPSPYGGFIVAAVLAGSLIFTLALTEVSYHPGTSAPMECHRGTGFEVIAKLAYMASGKPPPACITP